MSLFDYEALCSALEQLWRSFGVLPRVLGRTVLGRAVFALELGAGLHEAVVHASFLDVHNVGEQADAAVVVHPNSGEL